MLREALVVLAATILSACVSHAGPQGAKDGTTTSLPPAAAATPDDQTGAISGLVLDDEERPLAAVRVAITNPALSTSTDARGNFTFNGLAPGRHTLVFEAVGYHDGIKRVDITPNTVTTVRVVLEGVPIPESPYHFTVQRVALIHADWVLLTSYTWQNGVNNSVINGLVCDPCRFTIHFDNHSADVLAETLWRSGSSVPVPTAVGTAGVNAQVWLQYILGGSDAKPLGSYKDSAYYADRQSRHLSETSVKEIAKANQAQVWVSGNLVGVNIEHKVEVDTTFAYVEKLPTPFTALPPK